MFKYSIHLFQNAVDTWGNPVLSTRSPNQPNFMNPRSQFIGDISTMYNIHPDHVVKEKISSAQHINHYYPVDSELTQVHPNLSAASATLFRPAYHSSPIKTSIVSETPSNLDNSGSHQQNEDPPIRSFAESNNL